MFFLIGIQIKCFSTILIQLQCARCPRCRHLCIHSPSIIAMLYSMGSSIHMHGECERNETKPYWYHYMACSMKPYFVCLDFPNLITDKKSP